MAENATATPPKAAGAGWLFAAGSLFEIWGTLEQGRLARIQGQRARQAADFAAWLAEEEAGQILAASQRTAREERRQGELVASRALAVAAASGAGVSDPTIVNLIASARGEAAYRSAIALYEGEAQARQSRLEAAAARVTGADLLTEGYARQQGFALKATGRGLREVGSLYARYGFGGPGTSTTPTKLGDSAMIDD